jgi:nicotinic acid mononucleotide adenylyltransferase
MTNHIVVTRPGYEPATGHVGRLSERIVDLRSGKEALDQQGIFFTDAVMNDVSATNIRWLASEGRTNELAQLVPGPVLEYIRKYGIYRELNEAKLNS